MVLTCPGICTKWELIYTVNLQSLLFCSKKYGPGWMGGWVGGWMDGWIDGWMGGWVGGRAGLKLAYSNKKQLK